MPNTRVLIVDDEQSILIILERICRGAGYDVVAVNRGHEAINLLGSTPFDVCLTDLSMPDVNGIEILRTAKALQPECEVIIITGHADLDTALEALRLGAYDYLQKPLLDMNIIPMAISRALERRELANSNTRLLRDLQEANAELERRRKQQIDYIRHIGLALTSAFDARDVIRVLLQAILGTIDCDAAGVLVLPESDRDHPWAMLGTPGGLSLAAQHALVAEMVRGVPTHVAPAADEIDVQVMPAPSGRMISTTTWGGVRSTPLLVRGECTGIVTIVSEDDSPFSEEGLGFFQVLANQGGSALANARLFARARQLSTRDSLTGLYNHGHFFELLRAEISRTQRHAFDLAVIMLDIDRKNGLKEINDTYGHQAGDGLLRAVARLLLQHVRQADVVARYGGDEFIVMAPQTSRQEAMALAERLCHELHAAPIRVGEREHHISASFGVGSYQVGVRDTASALVSQADRGCYLSKDRGGNIVSYDDSPSHIQEPSVARSGAGVADS